MKKKGFTLIELLAVIVILAIIALIATPIILNVIEDAKKSTAIDSAYGYIEAIEFNNSMAGVDEDYQTITETDVTQINTKVNVKGKKPTSGTITLDVSGRVTGATLIINGYEVKYDGEKATVEGKKDSEPEKQPEEVIFKCKRATILHKEICNSKSSSGCLNKGYTKGSEIEYGSTGQRGKLASGDAFDCDVDGNGEYNSDTERFYYVTDIDTNNDEKNETAVLIYYNNYANGQPDNTSAGLTAYDNIHKSSTLTYGDNWYGPVTVMKNLPTTNQWNNVSLSSSSRKILTENLETSTNGGTLPTAFSYEGYAARLLTIKELQEACGIKVGNVTIGEIDECNYLVENTRYSSSNNGTAGYWTETPYGDSSDMAWHVSGPGRYVSNQLSVDNSQYHGTRPVIEVSKEDIEV